MAADPDCLLKLDRAFEHLEVLDNELAEWLKGKRITHDPDPQTGEMVVTLHAPDDAPELGLLIGECLHNARSFLDNLVFHMGQTFSGQGFTPRMQKDSEFPIFCDRAMTPADGNRKIGGIDPDARRIIEGLQPNCPPDYTTERMAQLHELDRLNKHRFMHPAATGTTGYGVGKMAFMDRGYIEHMHLTGGIASPGGNAEVCRYRGWHEIAGQRHMRVPLDVQTSAVFGREPVKGLSITQTLREVLEHVRDEVYGPLKRFC